VRDREATIERLAIRTYRSRRRASVLNTLARAAGFRSDPLNDRRHITLRTHFMGVVLVAMVPALIVSFLVGDHASRLAASADDQRRSDSARAVAGAIDQCIETIVAALTSLAGNRGLTPGSDLVDFSIRADVLAQSLGTPVHLRWGPAAASLTPQDDIAHGDALTREVVETQRTKVSDLFFTPDNHMPVAEVMVPVLRNGIAIGTVSTLLTADQFGRALRHQAPQQGSLAMLIDRNGRAAAASRDQAQIAGQLFQPVPSAKWWREAHETLPAVTAVGTLPGWSVLYSETAPGFSLLSGHPMAETVVSAALAFVLSLGMVALLAGRLTRPLRALTEQARNVATGSDRLAEPMPPLRIAEFDLLREGMVRADAVLRRRGAAERMALREARTGHELLASVINGAAESIYVKDLDLRYVMVNRAALLSGPEPRAEWQVLGRSTADLFPPVLAQRIDDADRAVLATGQISSFEQDYRLDQATGAIRWVSMTSTPWKDAEGRVVGVVSVGRDITQSRVGEARLRAVQADLLRATRLSAMGAMASGLAHELNQPLAAATNYLNASGRLLERGVKGDGEAFAASRRAASDGAGQLLRAGAIVRRLRDFVERGEAELQPDDIGHVLRETCDLARTDGVTEGVDLRLDLSLRDGLAMIDRTQIQQVLLNLIRNAAEAIGSVETATDHGEIVISANDAAGRMCIEVCDTGPGLPPGIAERLFQPFVSSKRTGMGIGLTICRTIIEGHGGRLTAEPNLAGGMLFRITLPASHPPGDSE
jgi:PAS domain S-box-containing protein